MIVPYNESSNTALTKGWHRNKILESNLLLDYLKYYHDEINWDDLKYTKQLRLAVKHMSKPHSSYTLTVGDKKKKTMRV
jgi:hypothetical protein